MDEKDICEHCGGKKFVELHQGRRGYGDAKKNREDWLGETVYHITCVSCGTVVRSYVDKIEELTRVYDDEDDDE